LQKKCFVASSGAHGLLLLVLLAAAIFHSEPAVTEEQVLTLISPRILDRDGSGGQAPAAVAPQPAVSQPQPQPQSQPPPVAPPSHPAPRIEPAPPPRVIETAKSIPTSEPKPKPERIAQERPSTSAKPTTKTHEVVADLSHTTRISTPTRRSNSTATAAHSTADTRSEEIARTFADLGSEIRDSAAKATVVTLPGEGGGEAFVGYETAIYNAYYHAWKAPQQATGSLAAADVKIVVTRDGSIISAELINPSGDSAIDHSVQRALDAVKQLPPFPESTRDTQRSFRISFTLDAKQSSG
jgi:TonB family protein